MTVTIGTDPELFLVDSAGAPVPVCGLIGGAKGKPLDLGEGYGVQEDNVMLEFNTPPADDPYAFIECVRTGIAKVNDLIRVKLPRLTLDSRGERLFTSEQLADPKAMTFGCSPDFDGHGHGKPHTAVDPARLHDAGGAWRFAGGHVHLGYKVAFDVPDFVTAAFGDIFLGLPSVGLDNQPKRRALYGCPGRYRPTKYGIEYRTLSNFWVQDSNYLDQVAHRAYALGHFMENCPETRMHKLFREVPWADVRRAINDEDETRAADVLAYLRHDMEMPEIDL